MSIGLQYQSSFYKPKTYKDMEETLFKLTRAITDTGTDTVSSDQTYIQGLSATGTTTMRIPFYANDSEPGSRIECTIGDRVSVYTKSGATWILEGSFIVPSAGGTVSISKA